MPIIFDHITQYIPDEIQRLKANSDDYWELHRMATQFKENKDWEGALACLMRAKYYSVTIGPAIDVQSLLRFPLFLQQAGKFEEAKYELQELYDNAEAFAKQQIIGLHHNQALYQRKFKALYLAYLFDKARLIYKRQKLLPQAEEFAQTSQTYQTEAKYIDELLEKQYQIESQLEREELENINVNLDDIIKTEKPKKLTAEDISHAILGCGVIIGVIWAIIHFIF